jgi:hypothetical protein
MQTLCSEELARIDEHEKESLHALAVLPQARPARLQSSKINFNTI